MILYTTMINELSLDEVECSVIKTIGVNKSHLSTC